MKDEKHTAPGSSVAAAGDLLANKTENTFMELGSPDGNTSQHLKRTHPQPTDPRE
jgi:hypothetical protein